MTENKKKTTKKEVVEQSDAPVKETKRARTKETKEAKEQQDVLTETLSPEEVSVVTAEVIPEEEKVAESVKAEDYGFETEDKKEKKPKKAHPEPETEPELEIKSKAESRIPASAEDFDWENFESEELRNSPKYKEYESMYDE